MPHITLEYTANIKQQIDFQSLFGEVHAAMLSVGGINVENCKSRAIRLDDYLVASGDPTAAFAHLDVRFLEGREMAVRQAIGDVILETVGRYVAPAAEGLDLQVTVEIQDIERDLYFKKS